MSAGVGRTTMLNRRFRAADMSLTPLSRVLAVAMTEKPFWAGTSSPIGEPGTAKSWLSEHLAAAITGDSTKVVQGTAGTTEEQIKYSWNYAMLIAKGPWHRPGGHFPPRGDGVVVGGNQGFNLPLIKLLRREALYVFVGHDDCG